MRLGRLSIQIALAFAASMATHSALATPSLCRQALSVQRTLVQITPMPTKEGFSASPKETQALEQVIHEINTLMGPDVMVPHKMRVYVHAEMSSAHAAYYTKEIVTTVFRPSEKKKVPQIAKATLAHEYGHHILFENLVGRSRYFSNLMAGVRKVTNELKSEEEELGFKKRTYLRETHETLEGRLTLEKIQLRLSEITSIRKELRDRVENRLMMDIAGPYQEFFADTVAVAWSRNPSIIKRIADFYTPHHPEPHLAKLQAENRDFRRAPGPTSWEETDPLSGNIFPDTPRVFQYLQLARARAHVWNQHLKHLEPDSKRSFQVMNAILSATIDEIDRSIERSTGRSQRKTVKEMNDSLIEAIDRKVAELPKA